MTLLYNENIDDSRCGLAEWGSSLGNNFGAVNKFVNVLTNNCKFGHSTLEVGHH